MDDVRRSMARYGLVRPQATGILGGVCAGVGQRFGIPPWPARLLFVLLLMAIPGSQFLIYPVLWVLMPAEDSLSALMAQEDGSVPARWTPPAA